MTSERREKRRDLDDDIRFEPNDRIGEGFTGMVRIADDQTKITASDENRTVRKDFLDRRTVCYSAYEPGTHRHSSAWDPR